MVEMSEERVEEKKGFKVVDKRFFAREDRGETPSGGKVKEPPKEAKEEVLPKVTFSSFIYSLSTTCLVHLGEVPDPTTSQRQKNLALAKQTIDVLEMLAEKTKGNLTEEEEGLLRALLTELRVCYVKAVSQGD